MTFGERYNQFDEQCNAMKTKALQYMFSGQHDNLKSF